VNLSLVEYRPPRIAMLLLLVAAIANRVLPLQQTPVLSFKLVAICTGVTGFAIMITAWWQFREQSVAICPTAETAKLITDGIYRHTRNPMYLGMIMMLVAVALWTGTVPFFAAAIAFFLVIQLQFCPFEETKLLAAFGNEYRIYAARVRRWV